MNRLTLTCTVAVALLGLSLAIGADTAETATQPSGLRIGVYDSRAVAIAYANSKAFHESLAARRAELEQAKTTGDEARVKELEAWGPRQQQRLHQQGFGTAPVTEILATIKDRLPEIAAEAGVALIVSKWQVDYLGPAVEPIDITGRLVAPFAPNARTRKWLEQMEDKAPLSHEEIEAHGHDH